MSSATAVGAPALPPGKEETDRLGHVIPSPFRVDLVMQRQFFRGEEYYVIKDPLALTYFRLQHEEGFLVTLLDGKRTMREIVEIFNRRFPNHELRTEDVAHFVNQMSVAGLLNVNARRFVGVARAKPNVRGGWILIWAKLFSSLLFMRIPLVDPSPWLGGLTHRLRFIWTKPFITLCLGFIGWSIFWLIVNRQAFAENTINFFSPENLFLVWVTIILVKTLHEFGHATTCRHFGGEVHEMGVCLICFAPAGYVDASDAWMMREKKHKLYTTIAGIFTEFVIAGIAAHLWLYLPPGLAKNLAFNAMMVASINTIFFNANPLMKFDGYYVVSDLLEIPNLRAKAMAYCSYQIQRVLLGFRNLGLERALEDERDNRVFAVYAVVAYLYMAFIIYSVSQVFAHALTPYGLREFGLVLGVFVQASFLMFPVFKIASDAISAGGAEIARDERLSVRVTRWLAPLVVVLVAIAMIPSHYSVSEQAVLVASRADQAGVEIGGEVVKVHVETGDWVEAGAPLLTLANREIETELRVAQLDLESARLRLGALQSDGSMQAAALAPQAALSLEAASTAYERALRQTELLVVRAPVSGYVVTPDIKRIEGQYLPTGFNRVRVANLRQFKLLIPLTETEAELVEVGSKVRGRTRAGQNKIEGTIVRLPGQKALPEDYHPAMYVVFGGPAPMDERRAASGFAPEYGIFIAEAELPELPPLAFEGLRALVDIEGKRTTVGHKVWRWFAAFWHTRSTA